MPFNRSYYLNRTLCDVLDEMRKCDKVKNYSALLSLIEEAQIFGNRMESALDDSRDLEQMYEEKKRLKKELKVLRAKCNDK